uniref:Phospholipase-like protein n=1 Tax=Tanacetum cinerariifolium TaxID=118510 RepID=A0A6L2LIQ3_TANCI|nr:phospholipase-like protein [Tanacetum cinerariifolium]
MKYAMQPVIKALIAKKLLRHPDVDVNISVACKICEVFRIMGHNTPYNDEQMKDFFELVVITFEKLFSASGGSYTRMYKVLRTLDSDKFSVMMCDLQLDGLIVRLFKQFLTVADSNTHAVVMKMKKIMTMIIEESELQNRELVDLLVTSVRKENEISSPVCWQLGGEVFKKFTAKLKPHLQEKVAKKAHNHLTDTNPSITDSSKLMTDATRKRKLECLDGSINMVQPIKRCQDLKTLKSETFSTDDPPTPTKSASEAHSVEHDENLVGRSIKVWWPEDEDYYQGVVKSFDRSKKQHQVLYDDGEEELLDLKQEQWELVVMTSKFSDYEIKLMNIGKRLLLLPSSTDELLDVIKKMEKLLYRVQQTPSESMKYAMHPIIEALVAKDLLRHPDMDVNISVACCICEVLRIMDDNASYNEEQMKDFFELAVITFEKLSSASGGCYAKLFKVLKTLSGLSYSVLESDLRLNGLIVRLFKQFITVADSNTFDVVLMMRQIMTTIIEESEPLNLELVDLLVMSVRKENQITSPVCWQLGDKILRKCAAKLKPHLPDKVLYDEDLVDYKREQLELVEIVSVTPDFVGQAVPQCGMVCVQGYKVKQSIAPFLEAIFKKHGDIASECVFKTHCVRESFLEAICEVVRKIQTNDLTTIISKMEEIECRVSEAQAANINVSWLQPHLETIHKKKSTLTKLNIGLVKRSAIMDLKERRTELVAAQDGVDKAERCVKVLNLVEKMLDDNLLKAN